MRLEVRQLLKMRQVRQLQLQMRMWMTEFACASRDLSLKRGRPMSCL